MQMGGVMGGIYTVCDWIWKIALVNILWILFTLSGFIVFGIMPATVALFTVVRKWTMKESDIPIFPIYLQTYKKEFLKANIVGLTVVAIGFILFFDYRIVMALEGTVQFVLSVPLFIIIGLYLITLIYLFPVYVHYDLKLLQYYKNALYIGILNMHITILIAAVLLLIRLPLYAFPGLIPFFSVSVISIVVMFGAKFAIQSVEHRQKKYSVKLRNHS